MCLDEPKAVGFSAWKVAKTYTYELPLHAGYSILQISLPHLDILWLGSSKFVAQICSTTF